MWPLLADAGNAVISDPGYRLVRAAREAGLPVRVVPGPSAAVAALSVASLPTDAFSSKQPRLPNRRRCDSRARGAPRPRREPLLPLSGDQNQTYIPPVRPGIATALNYPAHGAEMTTGAPAAMSDASALDDAPESMDHFWQRAPGDRRQNPYLFLKPGSIAIGHGEPILMKPEREMVDWECELAVVIGRPANDVSTEEAGAHIFGYTMMNDVGDREGRGDDR